MTAATTATLARFLEEMYFRQLRFQRSQAAKQEEIHRVTEEARLLDEAWRRTSQGTLTSGQIGRDYPPNRQIPGNYAERGKGTVEYPAVGYPQVPNPDPDAAVAPPESPGHRSSGSGSSTPPPSPPEAPF